MSQILTQLGVRLLEQLGVRLLEVSQYMYESVFVIIFLSTGVI